MNKEKFQTKFKVGDTLAYINGDGKEVLIKILCLGDTNWFVKYLDTGLEVLFLYAKLDDFYKKQAIIKYRLAPCIRSVLGQMGFSTKLYSDATSAKIDQGNDFVSFPAKVNGVELWYEFEQALVGIEPR